MVRLAADADPGTLFGGRRPAVRVLVSADRIEAHADASRRNRGTSDEPSRSDMHGHLEGQGDAVSAAAIERHVCNTGAVSIGFDTDGQCVNVGRDSRLFTERQRIGLAARDGGCLFTGCDRPPSYCEAHHINPWAAKKGATDIADGVLLCRRHHLLIHNNRWDVVRDGARYFLRPPRDVDPTQTLTPMFSRSPALRGIVAELSTP